MMITNKLLIEEVEELKNLLSQGKTEIPSFWKCLWPGVVLVAWNMLCAVISVDAVYLTGKYIFHVLVFPVGVSIIMLLGIASSRSLFLSVPKNFREKSNIYRFFSKKVLIYAVVYMAVIMLLAICNRVVYDTPFLFAFMVILTSVFFGFVMNLDLDAISYHCSPLQ
ncbi:conjugal transfer entry exclusion protein TraS [Klebsiella pneumoniae]|nr:conjugal transfer entry exclusion protein TraS [Klebsiella pneumoniae]